MPHDTWACRTTPLSSRHLQVSHDTTVVRHLQVSYGGPPIPVMDRGGETVVRARQSQSRSNARAAPDRLTFTFYICQIIRARLATNTPRPFQTATSTAARSVHAARRDHTSRRVPRHTCAMRHGPRAPTLDERALSPVAVHGSHHPIFPVFSPPRARLTLPPRCLSVISLSACLSHRLARATSPLASGRPRVGRVAHVQHVLRRARLRSRVAAAAVVQEHDRLGLG